ncbi:MAG: hypothetical protein V1750_09120, partial [Acidobacteriota bacterium]
MTGPALPLSIPGEIYELTSELPGSMLGLEFQAACERLDRFVGVLAAELAAVLKLPTSAVDLASLVQERGWRQEGALALAWLLETLESYGAARRDGARWWWSGAQPAVAAAELRDEALAINPATAPAYQALELSARSLPAILRGEISGEEALFGPASLGMWFSYFSNSNPHYALNNTLAALAIERVTAPGASLFEAGGGGGSAAEAVLRQLVEAGRAPARYAFTEL